MRRTPLLAALVPLAALAAITPSAHAAAPTGQLSGGISCANGGAITIHTTTDAAGAEHVTAAVKGVDQPRWAGALVLGANLDAPASDAESTFVAHGGRFTAQATQVGAHSHNAVATFLATDLKNACIAGIVQRGRMLVVTDSESSLAVRAGRKPVIAALVSGTRRHRYQLDFTVKDGKSAVRQRIVRTANAKGHLRAKATRVHRVGASAKVTVKITDLTRHRSATTLTLG